MPWVASKRNHFTKLFNYKSFQSALQGTLKEGRKTRQGNISSHFCLLAFNFEPACSVGLMWLHHLSIEDTVQSKVFSVVSILSLSYFKPCFFKTNGRTSASIYSIRVLCQVKTNADVSGRKKKINYCFLVLND